jgi:hypothetical protein
MHQKISQDAPLDWYLQVGGLTLAILALVAAPDWVQYAAKSTYNALPLVNDLPMNAPKFAWQKDDAIERFDKAIVSQESAADPAVVNEIGAMGLYQFMPGTLADVAPSCIGRTPSKDEFLGDAGMQKKIAHCYWGKVMPDIEAKTKNPTEQCRMLAAYHYSGDMNAWDSTKPEKTFKGEYPSIAKYTEEVCSK